MTRKSWPWDYYNIDENDSKKGACKYCNKSYSGAHVDRMLVHLQSQCTEIPNADKNEILSKIAADEKRRATDGNINSINEKSQEPQNTTTLTLRQQEIAEAKSICKDDGKAFSSPELSEGSTKRNAQTKENLQKNQGEEEEVCKNSTLINLFSLINFDTCLQRYKYGNKFRIQKSLKEH